MTRQATPVSGPTEVRYENAATTLYAFTEGSGPPLVFCHGGLGDHRAAQMIVGPLADSSTVITPDVRGAGRSVFHGELSWRLLAEDIAALLRHLGLESALIGGVSMGSGVALALARWFPALVEGLVLVSPVYPGASQGLSAAQVAAMQAMDAHGRRAAVEGIEAILPLFAGLPEALQERARAMVDSFDPESVAATTSFLASQVQPIDGPEDLASLDRPAVVVAGTDAEHPREVAELYARWLPQAQLVKGDPTRCIRAWVERQAD